MGGCRCSFRDCTNSSLKMQGMSFFHFPYKEPVRFEKWLEYAQKPSFKHLDLKGIRNKVVCSDHFRYEHFMNYQKNKITRTAIPTLGRYRFNRVLVLDYEKSSNPAAEMLPKPTLPHLIPPADFEIPKWSPEYQSNNDPNSNDDTESTDEDLPTTRNNKVLNNICATASAKPEDTFRIPVSDIINLGEEILEKNDIKPIISKENQTQTTPARKSLSDQDKLLIKEKDELKHKINDLEEVLQKKEQLVTQLQNQSESKISELQSKIDKMESQNRENLAKTQQLNLSKAQLYNGIKKYLCPAMATLVRMEMFGGAEREWKKDEKIASIDLLKLGDGVYNYFRDEWRLHLPAKKDVKEWADNVEQFDEDDL
uniref:THAP-type domain-containing protein n=1 Tax=Megaselia scalaris TaxID=36166 RepID=T1H096_MEGSC